MYGSVKQRISVEVRVYRLIDRIYSQVAEHVTSPCWDAVIGCPSNSGFTSWLYPTRHELHQRRTIPKRFQLAPRGSEYRCNRRLVYKLLAVYRRKERH